MKKQKFYIIEFDMSNEKQLNEMDALELENFQQGIEWIQGIIESDNEYFNIDIDYNIEIIKYKQYGSDLDFYAKAFVSVEYDSIVTYEMIDSEVFDIKDIIEDNLSVISEIKLKMVKE